MKNFLIPMILLFSIFGCTESFDEINSNPNNPRQATENLLLPSVIFDLSNTLIAQTYNFGQVISQYGAQYQFNDIDIYSWQPDDRFWSPMYHILQDVTDIENRAAAEGNNNYEAVAKVLKAYILSIITDAYGDAPMLQSNKAKEGINTPSYDRQEDIYNAIFELLEQANAMIDANSSISGDILFDGDMLKWKKFANSLRLRYLLRVSNVKNVSEEMSMIVNDPNGFPVFESNEDDAIYDYSGSLPDIPSIVEPGGGRGFEYYLVIPTTHFINLMADNGDPRLDFFVSPRECDPNSVGCLQNNLQGVAPGLSVGDIGGPENYSLRSKNIFESVDIVKGIFMTSSELNFILAEARQEGLISVGTAQEYYNKAVTASFDQWEVPMPGGFLTTNIPYDGERLYEQKWLSLYYSGVEAWFDWKRTGKPAFIQAGPGTINNGLVPRRLRYPALEQSVNSLNYTTASNNIGGDDINSRIWWDQK